MKPQAEMLIGLKARTLIALSRVLAPLNEELSGYHWECARDEAWATAHDMALAAWQNGAALPLPTPSMFADDPELTEWFVRNTEYVFESLAEEQRRERVKREQEEKDKAVMANIIANNWESLGLPTPEELLGELQDGSPCRVDGYFLIVEDGVTWFTNPYGQDGVLGDEPDLEMIKEFLSNIAQGEDYGAVPPGC